MTAGTPGRLHVEETGVGSAVVLLHGMPSSPSDFAPVVERLALTRRVLVPHLPGYGQTPPDSEPRTLESMLGRLEESLLGAGVTHADFVAFSAGAYAAVALALRDRLEVSRLVLFAPVVGLDESVAQAYRTLAAAARDGSFDARPTWLERMGSRGLAERDPKSAARVLAWLDAVPLSVLCDELERLAEAPDLRPRLGVLRCPVLVCAGTADNAVPFSWSEAVARSIPHCSFERIEGAGHSFLVEAPEHAARLVANFLAATREAPGEPTWHDPRS